MRNISKLPSITGVEPGNTVSLDVPVGLTYDKIHFKYSGATAAQLKNIRIELNGKLLTEYKTLQDVLNENNTFKREVLNGYATLHFVRDELNSAQGPQLVEQRFFALGTAGLSTVQIKFDIDPAAVDPKLEAFAEKSDAVMPGWLFKRRSFYKNLVVGTTEMENIPRPIGAHIAQIIIKAPGVTGAEFLVDNVKWRENIPLELHNHILKQHGRSPRVDEYLIDFMMEGDMYGTLKLDAAIRDMRLRIDSDTEGQAEIIVYYFADYAKSNF
ncbi:MAG: capsid protein [Pseudoalteromonadaceae bacterium]|nr:capsid protein [Pseudoalteromonadaceae bacterium]|tara:strand:- start:362 stop:1171 length:810 start_codon:yes stop_codon:yes gene_type:complete